MRESHKNRVVRASILATLAFVSLATLALAQVRAAHPVAPSPGHSASPATPLPLPSATFRPIPQPSIGSRSLYVGAQPKGARVPLSRLPHRPFKTMLNTVTPDKTRHGGRFHPMAATAASLTVTAAASCATGGTLGTLYNVGCQLTIAGSNLNQWSATDTYQDYAVFPNSPTAAVAACATYVGNADPGCTNANTQLTVQGTYMFGVYDTTAKAWVAVVYANAGQVFTIQIYQDAFHTEQSYQFDTGSSPAAYIFLQNVAPSDYYVTYVMSTGVNAYCVYMSPSATPAPPNPSPRPTGAPNSLLCNPSISSGVQAAGGDLSVTWPFTSSLESGTYAVVVYDKTQNVVLGQVQVSLTSGGAAILTEQTTPNPNPSPGFTPSSTTELAWDSSADQSVGGIVGTTQQVISPGTYSWTLTDPNGKVVAGPTSVTLPSNSTTTASFSFSGFTVPPGEYPSAFWALELYEPSIQKVIGSQAWELVGYHATTSFIDAGVTQQELNFEPPPNTYQTITASLKFTNDANIVYNGAADSISGIEFTTGNNASFTTAFNKPPVAGTDSDGTHGGVTTVYTTGENCHSAAGCVTSINDSSGNAWTVTHWCSTATPTTPNTNDLCVWNLLPTSASTVLKPGGSITIPNITWYAQGTNAGWPCYITPCFGLTTILPTHGIAWSNASNASNPVAWTPVSFGSVLAGGTITGTARFDYIGSRAQPPAFVTQGTAPWTEAHYYQSRFTRAGFQNSTPFALSSSRTNAISVFINNTGNQTISNPTTGQPDIAIGFPSYISASQIAVDAVSTATWTKETCPASFGVQYFCVRGPTINNGANATVVLDLPLPVTSFVVQELSIEAYSGGELTWFSLTSDGTNNDTLYNGNGSSTSVDSLGFGAFSLNSNLMSAAFTPTTVGTGLNPTPLTILVQNTSTAADPNPDPIDAIVIEQTTNKAWTINGTPTVTGPTGWTSLNTGYNPSGNTLDYWFGVCAGQYVTADGPPQTTGTLVPLTAQYPALPACTNAQELNSLAPGKTATINMNLTTAGGIPSGTVSFNMYAHGANSGGWSLPKAFTLTVNSESANAGFSSINGTAVATNSLPTIGSSPNTFVYTLSNTSSVTKLKTILITLPAFDTNGLAAQNGTAQWSLVTPIASTITLGGTGLAGAGCAVNTNASNTFNPVPGSTNGQIEVDCSTGIAAGKTLTVQFQANSPGLQGNTYSFPSTVDGIATGPTWIGDQEVQESFSVGLTVVVKPSNPGPGGSTPVVSCASCAFSGSTIDFGAIANSSSVSGKDVVRASVIYTGSTVAANWTLTVSLAGANPTCVGASCGGIASELLTSSDSTNSKTQCGSITITGAQSTLAAVPSSPSTLTMATGTETQCSTPYDVIENYLVQVGTEAATGHILNVTYTLIP